MKKAREPRRRVVCRRDYVSITGKKFAMTSLTYTLLIATVLLFAVIVTVLVPRTFFVDTSHYSEAAMCFYAFLTLFAVIAFPLLCWLFWRVYLTVEDMESVRPITRHNTADLPEDATLVRASAEPPAHQAEVLLR